MQWIRGFVFVASFASCLCFGEETFTDPATGETFPKSVSFNADGKEYTLDATGVATRKKLVIKVYSVAHYLQKGSEKKGEAIFDAIYSDANAKQLTLKWVRDVSKDKIQEAFRDGFKIVFTEEESIKFNKEKEQFISFFNFEGHKGDELIFRWIPGGTLATLYNGKELGTIKNELFVKGIWSIWLGHKSIVGREGLVSFVK